VIRRDAEADEARQRKRLENLRRRRNEWANANIGSAAAIKQDDDKRDPSPSKNKSDKKNSGNCLMNETKLYLSIHIYRNKSIMKID
jgi:hypothetical protein